eukprot:4906524-Pyramimonas_sp.AAC.1
MGDMQKRSDEVRTSFRLQPGYGMVHHRDKCVSLGLTEWFLLPQLTWKIEREDLLLTACSLGLLADVRRKLVFHTHASCDLSNRCRNV